MKKFLFIIIAIIAIYLLAILGYATYHDYQPDEETLVLPDQSAEFTVLSTDTLTLLTWNIGYGGLGAESDFFYADGRIFLSGGMMIRPPEEVVDKNIAGFLETIQAQPADIYLLQEVDQEAKRSYYNNQYESIGALLPGHERHFGTNLLTAYSPVPLFEPWRTYGYTHSGLATYSRFGATKTTRLQLPGTFSWPSRLFLLDRCAMEHRYPVDNGKELIVYNIHNSAYDKDGAIKRQQTDYLKKRWLAEYGAGNYVVVGGDWNQVPPHFAANFFRPQVPVEGTPNIAADLMPADWRWIFDPTVPTVRDTREIYAEKETFTGLIDFFLLSPNLRALKVNGVNLNFQYSDHQPVKLKLVLQ